MVSRDIETAIADLIAIGEIAPGADPGRIEDLVVAHARDLDGLETLKSLRTLSLVGCSAGDYRAVGRLPALTLLAIENSDLTSLEGVLPPGIQVVFARSCRLASIATAALPAGLQALDLSGNPIDDETAAALEEVASRGVAVTRDGDRVRGLNAKLVRESPGFVCAGVGDTCTLTVSGSDLAPNPERVRVETTVDQVEAAAAAGELRALAGIA